MAQQKSSSSRGFPSWAPPEVIALWEQECETVRTQEIRHDEWWARPENAVRLRNERQRREIAQDRKDLAKGRELLKLMLTHEDMRDVWRSLCKVKAYKGASQAKLFALAVDLAWRGPHGESKWRPVEREKWIKEVAQLATALGQKLRGTGADNMLFSRYRSDYTEWLVLSTFAAALKIGGSPRNRSNDFKWTPPKLSDLLREVAQRAKDHLRPSVLKKPGDRNARRAYFVRSLVAHCKQCLGGPRANLVAITAAVVLDDTTITERQVHRLITNDSQ